MTQNSFFGRRYLVDSDGIPLSDERMKSARAGTGIDCDMVRLAIYDVIVGCCLASMTAGKTRWPHVQDTIFKIADDTLKEWISTNEKSLTDILDRRIREINAAKPTQDTEKWKQLFAKK